MTETISYKVVLSSDYQTTPPIARVTVAGNEVFRQRVQDKQTLLGNFEIEDGTDNQIRIELFRKSPEDTTVDEDGTIVEDSILQIDSIKINDVELKKALSRNQDLFYYEHSGQRHQLFNRLGVNGEAVINFSSPIYVWLLENIV